jgi:hypothetical protein
MNPKNYRFAKITHIYDQMLAARPFENHRFNLKEKKEQGR